MLNISLLTELVAMSRPSSPVFLFGDYMVGAVLAGNVRLDKLNIESLMMEA